MLCVNSTSTVQLNRNPNRLARLDHFALRMTEHRKPDKVALSHNHHVALGSGPVQTDHLNLQCHLPPFPTLSVQFVTTAVTVVVSFAEIDSGAS